MIKVKDINGSTIKLEVRSFSYQGNFMGESFISFDVNSPVCINFEIGDYIEYRGERFVLNYIPSPIKNGTPGKSGDAFVYRDVKFNSLADELTRCDFLDVVLSDNHVHFTSLSKFSFYAATVKDLADRIQANLNRLYNGGEAWTVTVEEDVAVKDKSLSVDNINCWEALSLVNSDFDANFVISGRTIRIGTAGISVGTVFGYGKGNGLINIEQSTNNDSLIVTRLRAYGSTRNIPSRYYNNLKDSNGTPLLPESMYVNTLMLPGFAENGGDAYVDSPNITRIGIREKSVYFDGSGGLPEIYPSIEGMTAEELKAAGINVNATGRIDEVVSAEQMTDDGIVPEGKEELDKKTFTITLKDIGFNPVDEVHLTTETPYISMKTGWCGGREFEITGCEKKGNNYILTCNREMDSSINKAFPNNPCQVSAEDQFVFIGIAMDDIYIKAAEQRLLIAAKYYLSNNDKSKYTYLPKIDKVFMARHPEIASSLKEGNILDFKDTDLGIDVSVIIQSLVIKEGGPVPEYEITLFNDKVVSTIEKIQNSITSLASNTGITIEQAKSLFATWVEAWRVKWFDQKLRTFDPVKFNSVTSTEDNWHITDKGDAKLRDVIGKVITITDRLMTDNFVAGMTGTGVGVVNKAEVHMDKGVIRKYLEVLALVVAQMFYRGGRQVLSPAGMKINKVEEFDEYWRCYMETEDGQVNQFTVGAQARCNRYGSQQRYWWRLVDSIGVDYIDVSKTDMDAGSMAPAVGDEVVQFGHRTDPYLQWVVMDSSFSDDAGRTIYAGVNSYDLSGKWVLREGVSPTDPSRIGLFTRHGEFSDVIDGINEDIEDNKQSIQETKDTADAIQSVVDNLTGIIIPDMQNQLDGAIQSWDGEVEPTLNNYPANEWTTDTERSKHVGDTYIYYTTDSEGNTVSSRYNFRFVDGVYKWELIADSVSAELEVKLRELTGTVGKKNSITYSNNVPTPAYNIDDLWIKEDSSMYICRAQKMEGMQGSAADWELFNDTMLRLVQIASDNVISVEEKPSLRDTWSQIQKEFTKYQADATTYGVSITNLQNAYNALGSFLTDTVKLAQDVDTSLTVSQKADYNQKFANYYSERTAFANVIAQKVADESVGNLQLGTLNLLKGSNVELGAQAYLLGNYYYDKKPEVGKEYTIVMCYTLGSNNTNIAVYQDSHMQVAARFETKGDKIIESKSFIFNPVRDSEDMGFYQLPDGTYGSKVHWAVLVEGNKGPSSWVPSLSEQGEQAASDAVDNLQIGSVNLVSKKMMLAWNEKNKDIAVWGQDSDGIYLSINPRLLYENIGGSASYNDIFENKIKYKSNTQYVFSIEWKAFVVQTTTSDGLSLTVHYTDGTKESLFNTTRTQSTNTRTDFITQKGKTIQKISCTYGTSYVMTLVYCLALYDGNKVLSEPPVATEDLTGQSNVNLVDGGKEVTVESKHYSTLKVPVIKPNTVYTVRFTNVEVISGDTPSGYEFRLYDTGLSANYSTVKIKAGDNHGILITSNNFTVSIEGRLLFYPGIQSEGIERSVKYTEIMLVEGFTPPSSYSPSPGDVQKEIDDVSDAVSNLDTTINTTFKDGIISEAEAKAIASNINILNAEKADIDAYYNKLHANAYLTGTAKTNLASAKTAYNTAHANLINSINKAIADGKTTATEKADVDAKFTAYNNALSAYQTRVGEADKAIQDTIKKVADNAQASANTAQSAANAAQSTANQAQADAKTANDKLKTWASDNYISPQEKTGLKQQKSDIQAEYKNIEANANRYVISLASYMAAYNAAISALNKYTATSPENISVSSDYNNIAAYYTARRTILNSIAAAAKAQADKATGSIGMDGGKMLYKDPEFKKGYNGVSVYPAQNNGGKVMLTRIMKSTGNTSNGDYTSSEAAHIKEEAAGSPHNGSGWCLYIRAYGGTTTSHLGGFGYGNQSRAKAVFIVKVSAKIPVGYTLKNAHNAHGTGSTQEFLTSMGGTGKYETYIFKETCGPIGSFGTINWLYISGPVKPESDPLEWFVDYVTVFDMTADGYGDIESVTKDDFASQLGFADFDALVANAITKGPLIKAGYINADLIETDKLVVNDAFVNKIVSNQAFISKLDGYEFNFEKGTAGGFKMESTLLYSGAKFGTGGAGIAMQSMTNNYGFNVYKDNNNYVEMFQRSSEWGLKGVVNGSPVFQFGSTNKIGPFDYDKSDLISNIGGNKMTLNAQYIKFEYMRGTTNSHYVYLGTPGNAGYGSNTLLVVEGGDIYHQGYIYSENRVGRFYSSDIHLRGEMKMYDRATITDYDGNVLIKNGKFCAPTKSISFSGTSTSFTPSAVIYGINLIRSAGVNVKIAAGHQGQILILMNYSGKSFNIVKNNNDLITRVGAEKSAVLYFSGSDWAGLMVGDFYNT